MPAFRYQTVNAAWPNKFLPSYADNVTLRARESVSLATRLCVKRLEVQNRSGSVANIGFGGRLKDDQTLWKAGQWTNGTTTYTDDTPDAHSSGTNDFPLTTLVNNDGFIVLSQIPFNVVSVITRTPETGVPVYELAYSGAGGVWTVFPGVIADLRAAPAFPVAAAPAQNLIWWDMPPDWALTVAGHATGIPTGYYGIRMRATTAPTQAPIADQLIPGVIVSSVDTVADDGVKVWDFGASEAELPPQCDALALCMSVAGKQSQIVAQVRMAG